MKVRILSGVLILSVVIFSGCGRQTDAPLSMSGSTGQTFTRMFQVGMVARFQEQVYGTVTADTIENVTSSLGGMLDYLNCQPGQKVSRGTLIAKISANGADVATQNSQVQLDAAKEQIANLVDMIQLTANNFDMQKQILQQQDQNNTTLLNLLNQQVDSTQSDLSAQSSMLSSQLKYLKQSQNTDIDKMEISISNMRKQLMIAFNDTLNKINVTTSLSASAQSKYADLRSRYASLSSATDQTFSLFINDLTDLLTIAADASSTSQAYSGFSAVYTTLATTMMTSKTTFDNLILSNDALVTNYQNQISTLTSNKENLDENKTQTTQAQLDAQLANMQLTVNTVRSQLQNLDNSKGIQLNTLKNQLISLRQGYQILNNSLAGESLYATVDGVVKIKNANVNNKVVANTMLCQISPSNAGNLQIQVFSSSPIRLGQVVSVVDNGRVLGQGTIDFELPYKDALTQNYIYDISHVSFPLKEGERVSLNFETSDMTPTLRIPLSYVTPRLEGDFVNIQTLTGFSIVPVQLGDINDAYIKVLSGLKKGDVILN